MDLKGSRTEANLMAAFAGESQARNKYTFYSKKAQEDGYAQIAEIFDITAKNELHHAKLWFKFLHGGEIPATEANLRDAAAGEHFEWSDMYAQFAKEAKEEGFDKIAYLFEAVGEIEKSHEQRYNKLIEDLEKGIVFSREGDTVWLCTVCGHIHIGKEPPMQCPVCSNPKGYFKIKPENY
ncbi:MAG: rubrerythrin [Acutalibacteraceae bacterium]